MQLHNVERLLAQRKIPEKAGADWLSECAAGMRGRRMTASSAVPACPPLQNGGGARRIDSGIDLFYVEEFPGLA